MPRNPIWSVMIPTFHCAETLGQTLESVLQQDPGADLMQIDVVDDCSSQDDPTAVVEQIGRGRVGFFRQPHNVGHVHNFQTCLQRARGDLIHLLHGDDWVRDGFYKRMQGIFDNQPAIGAAFCRHYYYVEPEGGFILVPKEEETSGILEDWLHRIAIEQRIQFVALVTRRAVFERLGGFDPRFSWCGEDWEMWVRIAAHYPVWYEVEPLAVYRMHRTSLVGRSSRTGEDTRDLRLAIELFKPHLPPKSAEAWVREARSYVGYRAMFLARRLWEQHEVGAALAQVKEALRCSWSMRVMREVGSLGKAMIVQWMSRWLLRRVDTS